MKQAQPEKPFRFVQIFLTESPDVRAVLYVSVKNSKNSDIYSSLRYPTLTTITVVVVYPTPSEEWGHGGRLRSPRYRETLQGLDQKS